jgi:phosphonate transport system ATP-binding protein
MGQDITHVKGEELRHVHQQIAMVFQNFNLVKRRSVLTNVITGRLASLSTVDSVLERFSPEVYEEAFQALRTVGIEEKAKERADALSGGQQQRVAIARSLMQYFEKINNELGTTIICSLHFLSLVRRYATRVIALRQGGIIYQGDPKDINKEWFKTIYGEEAEEVEIR